MHISSLTIRNFRNFKNSKFLFKQGINTIIGENGSGKTNLFYAIRILLDNALPRYINFNSSDFNRSIVNWAGHWIIISIQFDELDISEEAQALALHSSGHMDTETKGSYAVYFRPKYQFRKELYDYSESIDKSPEGLRLLLDKLSIEDYEASFLSRGTGDFSNDTIYNRYVGNFDTISFPDPDKKEENVFGTWLPKEINIHNEVSCTFIKALRDVENDLRSYTTNPLISLLKGKEKTVEIAKKSEIIASIDELNNQISDLDEVKEIKNGIDTSIKDAVGTTYAPNIDIRSELPNEMDKLFQSLRLWVGDPDDEGYKGRLWELSLGGANLIYLSLKLLEYDKIRTERIANFLLIEEPEAHIHTHIQKTLFNNLCENRTQVIISTHSTHISSASNISSMNILSRGNKEAQVFHPAAKLSQSEVAKIERYLDAVRSNLLFAKGIILVEGDAEQILIPTMFKTVFGLTLDEIGVSLVNIGSTGFENIGKLFHEDRIRKKCAILTDLDKSIQPLPTDPTRDTDLQKHCRASAKSGEERKARLMRFRRDNPFIGIFFAVHTFEVDLLLNGNSYEFTNCLERIFAKNETIQTSKLKLESDSVEIAGAEILRIANVYGKGWLALLAADQIVYNTFFPEYILSAIAFASGHINVSSISKAVKYRIKSIRENEKDKFYQNAKKFRNTGMNPTDLVKAFKDNFPSDQLTDFLSRL
jgi:putative ATP-dependent endonuclease of the OLD family